MKNKKITVQINSRVVDYSRLQKMSICWHNGDRYFLLSVGLTLLVGQGDLHIHEDRSRLVESLWELFLFCFLCFFSLYHSLVWLVGSARLSPLSLGASWVPSTTTPASAKALLVHRPTLRPPCITSRTLNFRSFYSLSFFLDFSSIYYYVIWLAAARSFFFFLIHILFYFIPDVAVGYLPHREKGKKWKKKKKKKNYS